MLEEVPIITTKTNSLAWAVTELVVTVVELAADPKPSQLVSKASGGLTAKLAVIVPVPAMVAVVDADAELAKVIKPVLLDHEAKW